MTDIYDVIQAFADGEPVDPEELDRALADREGRAHLIDVLVLRGFVNEPGLAPLAPVAVAPARVVARPLRWLSIAALVTIAASVGGYVVGERAASGKQRNELAATSATNSASAPAAPTPTRVIRLEPSVDWTEHRGGQ
jgi:hypothetical protein